MYIEMYVTIMLYLILLGIGTFCNGRWSASSEIPFRAPVLARLSLNRNWTHRQELRVIENERMNEQIYKDHENKQWDYA